MASEELKIILEDVDEKFKTIMEGVAMVREELHRHAEENKKEHQELRDEVLGMKADILGLRRDLNDHRESTELHGVREGKKA